MNPHSLVCKIVVAGDGGVGKTTLVYSIVGKEKMVKITPGLEIENFSVSLKKNVEADVVFWDLGGQQQFRFFQEDFLHCANIILLVYDLNRYPSFHRIEKEWLPMVSKETLLTEGVKILVGNKLDLGQSINDTVIDDFVSKHNFASIKVSAKEGINMDKLVDLIIDRVKQCYEGFDIL